MMNAKIVAETHRMAEERQPRIDVIEHLEAAETTEAERKYGYIEESNALVLYGCVVLDLTSWIKEDQLLYFLHLVPDFTIRVLDEMKGANEIKNSFKGPPDKFEFYTNFYRRIHHMLSYAV